MKVLIGCKRVLPAGEEHYEVRYLLRQEENPAFPSRPSIHLNSLLDIDVTGPVRVLSNTRARRV
jgi:hypothetical protein